MTSESLETYIYSMGVFLSPPVGSPNGTKKSRKKRIQCALTRNLEDNHAMWVVVIKRETAAKEREVAGAVGGAGQPPRSPKDGEGHSHLEPIQLPVSSQSKVNAFLVSG